jgi:hypothetical protein
MFGLRFIKTQPNQYVIQFRNGRPHRQGAGLSLVYFAPTSMLVAVPTASVNGPSCSRRSRPTIRRSPCNAR